MANGPTWLNSRSKIRIELCTLELNMRMIQSARVPGIIKVWYLIRAVGTRGTEGERAPLKIFDITVKPGGG